MNKLKAVSILREKSGKPLVAVAKKLNVSRDNIYKTLSSDKTKLNNPTLLGICDFFGVSLGDFIKLAEECDK